MEEELKVQRGLNLPFRELDSEGVIEVNFEVNPPSIEKVRGIASPIVSGTFSQFHDVDRQQNFADSIEKVRRISLPLLELQVEEVESLMPNGADGICYISNHGHTNVEVTSKLKRPHVSIDEALHPSRRVYRKWSENEISALKEEYDKHGPCWSEILKSRPEIFKNRNNIALKDKFRNTYGVRKPSKP